MTNGELVEYKARTDFSNYINSIVEITFKNDLASISKIREIIRKILVVYLMQKVCI